MLAPETGWRIGVAHVNHCLRCNADTDEAFVVALAQEVGLPCYTQKEDVQAYQIKSKLSLEEAARDVRYRLLIQMALTHGYRNVALGHHADDNAELVLMNFLRGSGPDGLGGMSPRRPFTFRKIDTPPVNLIRPLIRCKRMDIEAFLQRHDFSYVLDESNDALRFRRNRIRHELLPHLQQLYNPNIVDTLNRTAKIFNSEKSWRSQEVTSLLEKAIQRQTKYSIVLSISALAERPVALKRLLLRKAIFTVKGNLRKITLAHIEAILTISTKGNETRTLDLPDRIRITRKMDQLTISKEDRPLRELQKKTPPKGEEFEYVLESTGNYFFEKTGLHISVTVVDAEAPSEVVNAGHKVAFFDINTVTFPLTIRNVKSGDRFTPLGMTGTQKVFKFLKDRKIPAYDRKQCPLLLSGGRVIWVMGHRLDDSVKITPGTGQILKVAF